ncbi:MULTISPECIES: CAP domain-containing protein [unclassified Sphingomonas]|uniref:CAP domain-containing protein n=1 Tax=unclassified Sphingomonas TaxID=196159 RepID=UPI00286CF083|nr:MULTISPECIES: CAP domain-containing protein [unclassified Sphingomonas]
MSGLAWASLDFAIAPAAWAAELAPPAPVQPVAPLADDPLRGTMLAMHNATRARVGVPPLAWDATLADAARSYAEDMARTDVFRHSPPSMRRGQGENLWVGSRGAYDYAAMATAWTDEARLFVNQPTPMFSITGHWQDVGHYSQIVWRSTTALGCAMASSASFDYVVCRYGPAGNVIGRTAF